MKLVLPYHSIVWSPGTADTIFTLLEMCARVCYKSEGKIKDGSAAALMCKLIKRNHWTPFEFVDVIVRFVCDRGISHELVRHRMCSFLQESSRYCDYGDGHVQFIIPYFAKHIDPGTYDTCDTLHHKDWEPEEHEWFNAMAVADEYYKQLRDHNLEPQGARDVLPNSLKTEVICKANLREWRHIFSLRCNNAAHPDMVSMMRLLLDDMSKRIPIVFDDLAVQYPILV